GVESRGMLLAASDTDEAGNERIEVLDAGDTPSGTPVRLEGQAAPETAEGALSQIDIKKFFSIPIKVDNHAVLVGRKALLLGDRPVRTARIPSGEVG
ncbi:methionine--tRNA ligase, partial [Treponema sp. OttesenSCG-928-L16]|nr:methionine--tRNA ligase [Treponema sp. OttesenSCG-928-L16]